ncbi:hypothetical protein F4818DRAFT_411755 [Hypoxylon cercidicola]|nr:hypothetical protein F4818DRAFT_411755 [Hypoxylon cercidicola]
MAFSENDPHGGQRGRLAPIENLHRDAMLSIIGQIPDVESLMNFIKASPNAERHFRSYEGVTCKDLLVRELGPHLPIAVARFEASRAEWRPRRPLIWNADQAEEYSVKLDQFYSRNLSDQATKLQVSAKYFTLEGTLELLAFHRCVLGWTEGISIRMIQQPPESEFRYSKKPYERQINDQERYRVTRMLYVTELVSILLPQRRRPKYEEPDKDWEKFWGCFAPWEFCQYLEMQTVIFESIKFLSLFIHGLPSKKPLRELEAYMHREPCARWTHLYEILAFQAGLEALKPAIDCYLTGYSTNPSKDRSLSKLYGIIDEFVEHPEMRGQWCCRYNIQWRWRSAEPTSRIYAEYKDIWLKRANVPSGDFVAYSLDTTHIQERYVDPGDGPLACWLYDILRYGERHERDKFRLRDDISFLMTSFWDRARWETIPGSRMPSVADLEKDASTQLLTDRDQVVPIAGVE